MVYNALAQRRTSLISLPVATAGEYVISSLHDNFQTVSVTVEQADKLILYFETGPLPNVGGAVYWVRMLETGPSVKPRPLSDSTPTLEKKKKKKSKSTTTMSHGDISIDVDR